MRRRPGDTSSSGTKCRRESVRKHSTYSRRIALCAVVVLLGLFAAVSGSTSALFTSTTSVISSSFRAMTFSEGVVLSSGTAKAVRTTDRPQPGERAANPVARVTDAGEIELDFGEVPPGNCNFPDTFRISNVLDEGLTLSITPKGEIASFIERVWVSETSSPFYVGPGETVQVDVKLRVPADTQPRKYEGSLTVGGFFSHDIPVHVTVVKSPGSSK